MHVLQLHRKVLVRLALAWASLSAVLGPAVLYMEMSAIDTRMLALATKEASAFIDHIEVLGSSGTAHREALRRAAAEALEAGFASARVYDAQQRMIVQVLAPSADVRGVPEPHVHELRPGERTHFHTYWSFRGPAMQVLMPIDRDGALIGYFEGVYELEPAAAQDVLGRLLRSLAIVLAAGFVTAASLYPVIILLNRHLAAHASALLQGNVELMEVLGSAIAMRDSDTHVHNYRVTVYAVKIAQAHGRSPEDMRRLIAGAFLHDVGKIGISDAILLKAGRLDPEEVAVMRTHVALGSEILSKAPWLTGAREVVENHHEKFDGSGYPKGVKGAAIPLNARIFAVADVFDALTSKRPYKEALPAEQALAMMRRDSGSHFDPEVFRNFDAIALQLYDEVSGARERDLRAVLKELVGRYFLTPVPGEPGSAP